MNTWKMGKGQNSNNQLKWRGASNAGTHTDYKESGENSTSSAGIGTGNVKGNYLQEENHFYQEKTQLHYHPERRTSCETDLLFHDKGDLLLGNRIQWNNDAEEADHSHYYKDESMNIRSLEEDNDSCVTTETMQPSRTKISSNRHRNFWLSLTVSFIVTTLILLTSNVDIVNSCNEAVCASIVSKCTLTQSCKCELRNCSCCKECFECLTYLYDECCSCVELCPKPNVTHHVVTHSQVGDLKEPIDELFKALTEEKDIQGRWGTFTYPIDIDQSWFMPKPESASSANVYTVANGKIIVDPSKEVVTVNCTVAYMSECMPLNKCRNSCHSMGASYFRWFHDGCCECIGSTCINYGIDESRCSRCSIEDDAEDDPAEPTEETVNIENDTGKDT